MRLLDLFCGRWGWSRAFAKRGWECVGVDLVGPLETPLGCTFFAADVMNLRASSSGRIILAEDLESRQSYFPDFIVASPPCEEFSVHGMKHFHPNPKYPENGIRLFNHTRQLCEASGLPYLMENVRAAQQFVGNAVHHAGPFYLWGNAVPPLMPRGIKKGMRLGTGYIEGCGVPNGTRFRNMTPEQKRAARKTDPMICAASSSEARSLATASVATIPPELANCVADYAERILEQKRSA